MRGDGESWLATACHDMSWRVLVGNGVMVRLGPGGGASRFGIS